MKLTYSLLAAALACGFASAQTTAYTTPVGYETLALGQGTNYIGVRLHEPALIAGTVDTIGASQMTDAAVNFSAALTDAAATYIVEFDNANGTIQEILGSAAQGSTLALPQNVSSYVAAGTGYRIRKASTLSSVFGINNSANLAPGYGGPGGADLVQMSDGLGGVEQYYYDGDESSWFKVGATPVAVDGSKVPIVYTDAILVAMQNSGSPLVVSGEVKTKAVNQVAVSGTNYLGSVFPVGATLGSAFGNPSALASIDVGYGGPGGADLVQIVDGASFSQYYYDGDESSWFKVASPPVMVDASTVALPSGFIFVNEGAAVNLLNTPPAYYSTL